MLNFIILKKSTMKKICAFAHYPIDNHWISVICTKVKDVLYLKNGSVINGTLIEITDNQYKIRTSDGSIFVFTSGEVDKYVKDVHAFAGRKKRVWVLPLNPVSLSDHRIVNMFCHSVLTVIARYTVQHKKHFWNWFRG